MSIAYVSDFDSNWQLTDRDNRLFQRIIVILLLFTFIMALVITRISLPPIEREKQEQLPPQLTRVIEQRIELPEPVIEPVVPEPEIIPDEPEPEPVAEVEPEVAKVETPKPAQLAEKAREKAKKSGLMAFSDDLAQMRARVDLNSLAEQNLVQGAGASEDTARDIISAKATQTSGGINTNDLSTDAGGGNQLAGRKNTEYLAPEQGLPSIAQASEGTEETVRGSRSQESIRAVFDQNKGAIYAIYRRALRQDPSLQGKVTIHVVIAPNGAVQSCELISSELNDEALENKLIARVKLINFGEQDVTLTELNYAFNFLPF